MLKNQNSGIYSITHLKTGNFYIGSAKNFNKRWSAHICHLKKNKHHSPYLQNIYNKYGIESLQFNIIEICPIQNLLSREQFYLDNLKPRFNTLKIAGSSLGHKMTLRARANISSGRKGKQVSTEGLLKMKTTMQSDSMRKHLSNLALGRVAPNKGLPMSQEQKLKISIAKKGKPLSDDHKAKIKASCAKGFSHSEETKRNISKLKLKFTKNEVLEIREKYKSGLSMEKLAQQHNVMRHTIGRVINGKGLYSEF